MLEAVHNSGDSVLSVQDLVKWLHRETYVNCTKPVYTMNVQLLSEQSIHWWSVHKLINLVPVSHT